jgi:hypothetical protein
VTVGELLAGLRSMPIDLEVELIAHPAYEDEIILGVGKVAVEDVIRPCGWRPCERMDKLRSDGKPSRAKPGGDHYHRDQVVRVSG